MENRVSLFMVKRGSVDLGSFAWSEGNVEIAGRAAHPFVRDVKHCPTFAISLLRDCENVALTLRPLLVPQLNHIVDSDRLLPRSNTLVGADVINTKNTITAFAVIVAGEHVFFWTTLLATVNHCKPPC